MKKLSLKLSDIFKLLSFAVLMSIFLNSCGSSEKLNDQQVAELISSKEFEIENDWAMPMRAGNINLIGNPNFIRFQTDSVSIFLPYFGVRQTGGGYGNANGIEYEGPVKNLKISENVNSAYRQIQFEGNNGTENLKFSILIFENGKTNTNVTSSQRDAISYRGRISHLPETE
ncbi:MAG: DUF4251 domain-containing protein [Christiangramia sp.]|nr:hypothetical protein [Christiangramia sp.]